MNVHSDEERDRMTATGAERFVVLDQGSRPGRALLPSTEDKTRKRVLIIDHHMSDRVSALGTIHANQLKLLVAG